jgi:superfamily II DNA helicase RecQ
MKKVLTTLSFVLTLTTVTISAQTAGTVNGMEISVEEANKALNVISKGQATWDKISTQQKEQVLKMIAPSKLASVQAKKELTKEEKDIALSNLWMQKKISETKISDEEAKKSYEKMKKAAKKVNPKKEFPSYEAAEKSIKRKMAQEKVIGKLMKDAKIKLK